MLYYMLLATLLYCYMLYVIYVYKLIIKTSSSSSSSNIYYNHTYILYFLQSHLEVTSLLT